MTERPVGRRSGRRAVGPIDISIPLFDGMPAFPGDPPFGSEAVRSVDRGDPYTLSALRLGSHAGTHIDPPVHFLPHGSSVDRLDLELLNGPAYVLEVPEPRTAVGAGDLDAVPTGTSRLLVRTANSARWARRLEFFPEYVALRPDAAGALRERGVRLVGIDALSIESDPTGRYPVHRELLSHGIPILEGLLLAEAPPGGYRLECLPLRIRGGDGGPARAVLWPE